MGQGSTLERLHSSPKYDIIVPYPKGGEMDTTTTLIESIAAGQFDNDLEQIAKAIENRRTSMRKVRTIADYNVGDRVKFNELTGTRYMVGQYATIVSKNRTKVVVRLENPMGRFAKINPVTREVQSANVNVPLSIIDPA